MTSFNHTNIKKININIDNGSWNPETHDIVLTYDPTTTSKFTIKMIKTTDDRPITDLSEAQAILKKFRNQL